MSEPVNSTKNMKNTEARTRWEACTGLGTLDETNILNNL
jgi:hypothetical protein